MLNLPLFGLISLLCLFLMDSIIMDQHRDGQRGHSSSLTFMLLQLLFKNSSWMIPSSNGNSAGMLPPRMKKDSCSAALRWKTLRKIRLRYRRTSDSPASVCPRLALPPLYWQCWDNDPFHRWNQTLSHVSSAGMKTVMPGFPRPPSDTLEYPNLPFLLDTKTDVRKCSKCYTNQRTRWRRQGWGK